jgi:CheY-like chemotaxis protein
MDRDQFRSLLHDALLNIHDYVALEKHPLTGLIPRPDPSVRRAENMRRFIWNGIEALKPGPQDPQIEALEWRYYLILSGRYIEGASVADMQKRLSLGERQERRLHGRAIDALEEVLWDRLMQKPHSGGPHQQEAGPEDEAPNSLDIAEETGAEPTTEEDVFFPVSLEPLQLRTIVDETTTLFMPRLQNKGGQLSVQVSANLPMIQTDRIILRQILLHLLNHILQIWSGASIFLHARANHRGMVFEILSLVDPDMAPTEAELRSNKLLAYWLDRLSVRLSVQPLEAPDAYFPECGTSLPVRFILELPLANQAKILVVDDHEPAIRIIQRYLSQTIIQAIGVSDPSQTLALARSLSPKAVLLDVMMPAIDGWEILQKLKSDPETHQIPVVVCSVWEQPDLAYSLGANAFLKKPISQVELLTELARLGLLDISGESLLKDS